MFSATLPPSSKPTKNLLKTLPLKPQRDLMSGYHVSHVLLTSCGQSRFSIMTPCANQTFREILFKKMVQYFEPFGWWLSSSRVVCDVFFCRGGSFAFCLNGSESYFRKDFWTPSHAIQTLLTFSTWQHENAMPKGHCVHWFLAVLCVLVKKTMELEEVCNSLR